MRGVRLSRGCCCAGHAGRLVLSRGHGGLGAGPAAGVGVRAGGPGSGVCAGAGVGWRAD